MFSAAKERELYTSAKTRPGADCGSDHQLLIAKLKLKLKKVEKATGLVRYNLNQTPYEYTVEVKNRFKELNDSVIEAINMNLTKFWEAVEDRRCALVHGVMKSWTGLD